MKNSHKSYGFTLIELMIIIAILTILTMIITRGGCGCASSREEAEVEARQYAHDLGFEVKGISCANRDTDGDGYVSCTLSVTKDGKETIQPIECAARYTYNNNGCRIPKMNTYGRWQ